MPEIGRWGVADPLAPLDFEMSPYSYVYNKPLSFVDPLGMHPDSSSNYAPGALVENRTGAWRYLGDNQWQTIWEAGENNSVSATPFVNAGTSSTQIGPEGGHYRPEEFSWINYYDGVNSRIGVVTAGAAIIKTYPDLYRNKGRFTSQYWSKVRMLGKSYKMASAIDKMANVKIKGLPVLGGIGAANELAKLDRLSTIHTSDLAAAAFNASIGLVAFTNPLSATAFAIYTIIDYNGALDPIKYRMSQAIDNTFDVKIKNDK